MSSNLYDFNHFNFNDLIPVEVQGKFSGSSYEEFKYSLIALMLSQRLQTFEDGVDGSGNAWESVSHFDADHKPLMDTGVLRNSFTSAGGQGSEYKEEIIGADEVALRTNVEYAAIHNEGGTINHPGTSNGFGKGIVIDPYTIEIKARPFDQFSEENLQEIEELTAGYLSEY